jgi:hypothetical protein
MLAVVERLPEPFALIARWTEYVDLIDVLDLESRSVFNQMNDYRSDNFMGVRNGTGPIVGYVPRPLFEETQCYLEERLDRDVANGVPMGIAMRLFTNGVRPLVPMDYLVAIAEAMLGICRPNAAE